MRTKRHMKLPNGFGQISKLKAPLRKPFRAMITIGTDASGRPICKILKPQGYFETYNEAYIALVEYHQDPYKAFQEISLGEIFQKWFDDTSDDRNDHTNRYYETAWKHISKYQHIRFKDIKIPLIKQMVSDKELNASAPAQIKNLLNQLYDYAVEHEIVSQNLSRMTKIKGAVSRTIKNHHMTFTDDEISKLWKNISDYYVRAILIQCYSGFRPGELCDLKLENIHLEENYMIGGFKTEAGTNRIVPIHPAIKNLLIKQIEIAKTKGSEYLMLNKKDGKLTPAIYRTMFIDIVKQLDLNPEHKCHDPRKYFVSQAKKYQLDEYAIKRIVGHTITDLTESVYTERGIDWLYSEICKIPG